MRTTLKNRTISAQLAKICTIRAQSPEVTALQPGPHDLAARLSQEITPKKICNEPRSGPVGLWAGSFVMLLHLKRRYALRASVRRVVAFCV